MGGTGISTCFPSPTTIVLGLGPDLPWADEPSPGILAFALASALIQCSSTDHLSMIPKLRRMVLAPLNLRRTITRPVSYYALFK